MGHILTSTVNDTLYSIVSKGIKFDNNKILFQNKKKTYVTDETYIAYKYLKTSSENYFRV